MIPFALEQIGGRAGCRDRGYQLAKQLMRRRKIESRRTLLQALFAARGTLTQHSTRSTKSCCELTSHSVLAHKQQVHIQPTKKTFG